jgi:S-adenosylmethionine:tRNA ribosyltransferase-isomerase
VRAVDGLLTGWHEPQASHLRLLEAVAGRPALELAYATALGAGYRWHEFGDVHLILPLRSPATQAVVGRSLAGARSLAPGNMNDR